MPHLVVLYTANLEHRSDVSALCRALADAMLAQRDDEGAPVFPTGGTRVLAYPAAHAAVADGRGDYGFVYLNLRLGAGRSPGVHRRVGDALLGVAREHFAPLLATSPIGITVQLDEAPGQVYDGKHSTLHPLFAR